MTIEVYNDQKLVIGYVVGKDILHALELIKQNFPNAAKINATDLPINDNQYKLVSTGVYVRVGG